MGGSLASSAPELMQLSQSDPYQGQAQQQTPQWAQILKIIGAGLQDAGSHGRGRTPTNNLGELAQQMQAQQQTQQQNGAYKQALSQIFGTQNPAFPTDRMAALQQAGGGNLSSGAANLGSGLSDVGRAAIASMQGNPNAGQMLAQASPGAFSGGSLSGSPGAAMLAPLLKSLPAAQGLPALMNFIGQQTKPLTVPLTSDQVKALGLPDGTVAQRAPDGSTSIISKPQEPLKGSPGDQFLDPTNPAHVLSSVPFAPQRAPLPGLDSPVVAGPDGKPMVNPLYVQARGQAAAAESRARTSSATSDPSDPNVQAWVTAITAGNATMNQVPTMYRNTVAQSLSNLPGGAFSPIAASRNTQAATRIAAPFMKLPQYELTANGLPYLQRIDAAMKTPGSVSDQDLLDSLTKLNTAGNAISDAQVKVITGGKSFADMAGTFANMFQNGGVLSDNQRQQIQSIAKGIYANYQKGYQPVYDQVTKQLTDSHIPKQFWPVPDLNNLAAQAMGGPQQAPAGTAPQAQPGAPQVAKPAVPVGTTAVGPNGQRVQWNGQGWVLVK